MPEVTRVSVDDIGVKYEFEAPNTSDGRNAYELVKRGDMSGSSFTYWSDESSSVSYTKDDDDIMIRHVKKINMVYEMTLASDPAYVQTNVTAREITLAGFNIERKEEAKDEKTDELRKREQAISDVRKRSKQHFFN